MTTFYLAFAIWSFIGAICCHFRSFDLNFKGSCILNLIAIMQAFAASFFFSLYLSVLNS